MVGVVFVLVYYFMPRAPYSILEQPSTLCCLCNSDYTPVRDVSDLLHEAQGRSSRAECNKDRYGNDGLMYRKPYGVREGERKRKRGRVRGSSRRKGCACIIMHIHVHVCMCS